MHCGIADKKGEMPKKSYDLEPYKLEILNWHSKGYSTNAITDSLKSQHPEALQGSGAPMRIVRNKLKLWLKEEELRTGKHRTVAEARTLLGEQTEDRVMQLERELIDEREHRKELERLLREHNKRTRVEESLSRSLQDQIKTSPYSPRLSLSAFGPGSKIKLRKGTAEQEHEMLLLMSDAHYPEVVEPEEAMGLAYGPEIARKRIQHIVDRTIRLKDLQASAYPIKKLTIGVLGDMLSGDIHEELEVSNARVAVEATTEMGYILYDVGRLLGSAFETVEMVIIPGNHPRLTKKPRAKKRYNNFEYLMGQITLALAKDTPNFMVKIPKDIVYTHRIFDWKIGFTHGDGSKAASFAGIPFYGLRQRSNANQAMRSRLGLDRLHMLCMGHFHQELYWNEGDCVVYVNASIKGGDEFGIVSRSSAPEPTQALLTFHPERGWVNTARISLEHVV